MLIAARAISVLFCVLLTLSYLPGVVRHDYRPPNSVQVVLWTLSIGGVLAAFRVFG